MKKRVLYTPRSIHRFLSVYSHRRAGAAPAAASLGQARSSTHPSAAYVPPGRMALSAARSSRHTGHVTDRTLFGGASLASKSAKLGALCRSHSWPQGVQWIWCGAPCRVRLRQPNVNTSSRVVMCLWQMGHVPSTAGGGDTGGGVDVSMGDGSGGVAVATRQWAISEWRGPIYKVINRNRYVSGHCDAAANLPLLVRASSAATNALT